MNRPQFLTLLIAVAALMPLSWAVSSPRAQTWKPQHFQGSAGLTLDQVQYVLLPEDASPALRAAVDDLSLRMAQRYGRGLELRSEGLPKYAIHFEKNAGPARHDGFVIRRERTRVVIGGVTEQSWQNAVYAIAHDFLGARWYWAGELGFEWADPVRRQFPLHWEAVPAFVQRRLYPTQTDFARRNRLNEVYSFNHNLAKVFSPERFDANPEVFATVNGQRRRPKGHGGTDPQPDFTQPDSVRLAAEAAIAYFEKHPERTSFSLSINDNVLFDTTEATEQVVAPLRYFRGRPDYTDLVFGFMNRVAAQVFEEAGLWQTPSGEDRYLTALAYYWTEAAPSLPIHPRVMPVLTSDRAQWHDPDYRAEDQALIADWAASGAERIATWDYYFGAPYIYPRQFNQWIAESLRYLSDAGVDVFFSQLPSFWGLDGAKAWLASELLWDPEQDADALLDEFYSNFFGPAAGPIRDFYETAERYRNAHEGRADWIKLYKDESGVALFTPEVLGRMRASLDQALALAAADARRMARVQVVSGAFRLTELYAAMDRARRAVYAACLRPEPRPEFVASRLNAFRTARDVYEAYLDDYVASDAYAPERRRIDWLQSNPERLAQSMIAPQDGSFTSQLEDATLEHQGRETRNFLGPSIPRWAGWNVDYRPSEHFRVEPSRTVSGNKGLWVEGADIITLFRSFPVISNRRYELKLQAGWNVSLDNRVYIHVTWLDRDGRVLDHEMPLRIPNGRQAEPVSIQLPFVAPNNAYDFRMRLVVSRQSPGDYFDLSRIDFGQLR